MLFRAKAFRSGLEKPCIIECDDSLVPANGVYVVYGFVDPRTSDVFYVGQTCQFVKRMRKHVTQSEYNTPSLLPYRPQNVLNQRQAKIYAAGLYTQVVILSYAQDLQEAGSLEVQFIERYAQTVMNRSHGREWRRKVE